MKKILLISYYLIITIFTIKANAFNEKECDKQDVVKIEAKVDLFYFEPRVIFLKEKDKVCLFVTAVDVNIGLRIQNLPVMMSVLKNRTQMSYFKVDKPGEYSIICQGCAMKSNPKIVVQSSKDFDKWQEEKYRENSENYRKKVKEPEDYQSTGPFHKKYEWQR